MGSDLFGAGFVPFTLMPADGLAFRHDDDTGLERSEAELVVLATPLVEGLVVPPDEYHALHARGPRAIQHVGQLAVAIESVHG